MVYGATAGALLHTPTLGVSTQAHSMPSGNVPSACTGSFSHRRS